MKKPLFAIPCILCATLVLAGAGKARWTVDGVAVCTTEEPQEHPEIVSDGAGGAIITWQDDRSGAADIYAQRVNSNGVVQWTADGIAICTATEAQENPQIVSDGSGGAIITWQDDRSAGTPYDIYAQRVNSNGVVQWAANGVAVCTAAGSQQDTQIVSNGSSGAVITWWDYRSGTWEIYAQRVNSSGVGQWKADGVAICTATGSPLKPRIAADDSGGAIVTWQDLRSGNWKVYAQRVNSNGVVQWAADGVDMCTGTGAKYHPEIAGDGSGGAVITWYDGRGATLDIYAQRVNSSGVVQWTADGVAVCTETGNHYDPQIAGDGSGGAVITWQDGRGVASDIYAQRVRPSGIVQWTANGVAVCTEIDAQFDPQIAIDGAGGAIITWTDNRCFFQNDIYAQRVTSGGNVCAPAINPFLLLD